VISKARLSTIGFTQTTAKHFFERLMRAGVKKIVDVRLNNTSQLSGFAKSADLAFFLRSIGEIDYVHEPSLAPTETMLKTYRRGESGWEAYETHFRELLKARAVEQSLTPEMLDGACLLCSESTPHRCHRRLVCEYLNEKWNGALQVRHL
jgi:uncharacterized protein (DUF488 family)